MPDAPRIALVHDWLTVMSGSEQVLRAIHELYPAAPIFTSLYRPELFPWLKGTTVHTSALDRFPYLRSHHQVIIPLMPTAFESFDLKGFDVVISIGNGLSKGVITHPGTTHLSYCNTPLRFIWKLGGDDRNEKRYDSWLRQWASHGLRQWDVLSAERVDTFLANSQTVRERIAKIYRRDSEVVYPPVDTARFPILDGKPGDYLLSVSRHVPYKRIDLIVRACVETKTPLKVASDGPERAALEILAKDAPWVEFLGRVSDSQLPELYGRARAFVFAAEEDFGIVPVEAMCAGRPVIAFGKGGVTETVVEGESGTFFPEQTVESLVQAIERFNPGDYNPAIVRKHALRFDTAKFKEKMQGIIARCAK